MMTAQPVDHCKTVIVRGATTAVATTVATIIGTTTTTAATTTVAMTIGVMTTMTMATATVTIIISVMTTTVATITVTTIIDAMKPPNSQKDVQNLIGCMDAPPFCRLLKKQDKFLWTDEARVVFDQLKSYLSNPPVLIPPKPNETIQLYISVTTNIVSTLLAVDRQEEGHIQKVKHPGYFWSLVISSSFLDSARTEAS